MKKNPVEVQRVIATGTQAITIGPRTKRMIKQGRRKHTAPPKNGGK